MPAPGQRSRPLSSGKVVDYSCESREPVALATLRLFPFIYHASYKLARATTMFGRITRLAVDLIAISTIIAGVKRTTGFA